jgi:hypothetical protein
MKGLKYCLAALVLSCVLHFLLVAHVKLFATGPAATALTEQSDGKKQLEAWVVTLEPATPKSAANGTADTGKREPGRTNRRPSFSAQ